MTSRSRRQTTIVLKVGSIRVGRFSTIKLQILFTRNTFKNYLDEADEELEKWIFDIVDSGEQLRELVRDDDESSWT